jgi:hypothetical protein
MPVFSLASLYLHELIEFQNLPLAACIALATFMKNRDPRMENTFLVLSAAAIVLMSTCSPSTYLPLRDL